MSMHVEALAAAVEFDVYLVRLKELGVVCY